MEIIYLTFAVFQFVISPSKLFAPLNIQLMSVTLEVFHFEISPLKFSAPENMKLMSVTLEVFQSLIFTTSETVDSRRRYERSLTVGGKLFGTVKVSIVEFNAPERDTSRRSPQDTI